MKIVNAIRRETKKGFVCGIASLAALLLINLLLLITTVARYQLLPPKDKSLMEGAKLGSSHSFLLDSHPTHPIRHQEPLTPIELSYAAEEKAELHGELGLISTTLAAPPLLTNKEGIQSPQLIKPQEELKLINTAKVMELPSSPSPSPLNRVLSPSRTTSKETRGASSTLLQKMREKAASRLLANSLARQGKKEQGDGKYVLLPDPTVVEAQTDWPLWWFSPFFDRTSFGKEASTIILGAMRSGALNRSQVWLGTTEGDCSLDVDNSMPRADFDELAEAVRRADPRQAAIVVCHSLPPFWSRPKNKWPTCAPCPPIGYTAAMAIGRAMAETDIYNSEFVRICNTMDEIWVPSKFSRDTLIASGVPSEKLRIVPIAVNVTMFDPQDATPLWLPGGELVFGSGPRRIPYLAESLSEREASSDDCDMEADNVQSSLNGIDELLLKLKPILNRINKLKSDGKLSSEIPTWLSISRDQLNHALEDTRSSLFQSLLQMDKSCTLGTEQTSTYDALIEKLRDLGPEVFGESDKNARLIKLQDLLSKWSQKAEVSEIKVSPSSCLFRILSSKFLSVQKSKEKKTRRAQESGQDQTSRGQISGGKRHRRSKPFAFVSTFKWEMRKGWDVLLAAYLQEFSSEDDVELYILTKPFANSGDDFVGSMQTWASEHLNMTKQGDRERGPALYVISQHMTAEEYVGLYKSTDCYVIPTRGEGWGMPITEAMSMGLPAIVTNWSGTTDFVDDRVGYLVNYSLSSVPDDQPWWFRGARWADASVDHLRSVMRHVYEHPEEAAMKGQRARQLMSDLYSPEAVGRVVASEVERIKLMLRAGNCTHCFNSTYVAPLGDRSAELYLGTEEFLAPRKIAGPANDASALAAVGLNVFMPKGVSGVYKHRGEIGEISTDAGSA